MAIVPRGRGRQLTGPPLSEGREVLVARFPPSCRATSSSRTVLGPGEVKILVDPRPTGAGHPMLGAYLPRGIRSAWGAQAVLEDGTTVEDLRQVVLPPHYSEVMRSHSGPANEQPSRKSRTMTQSLIIDPKRGASPGTVKFEVPVDRETELARYGRHGQMLHGMIVGSTFESIPTRLTSRRLPAPPAAGHQYNHRGPAHLIGPGGAVVTSCCRRTSSAPTARTVRFSLPKCYSAMQMDWGQREHRAGGETCPTPKRSAARTRRTSPALRCPRSLRPQVGFEAAWAARCPHLPAGSYP